MPLLKSLKVSWLSPHKIESLSSGEITNSKTLNPRTLKPEFGGLFDPRIFGPFLNYECYCGKYRGKQNKGQKCEERCGVEVTEKIVQRWRRGHVTLASPVTNIILFNILKTNLSHLLNISSKNLEEIIYLRTYVVVDNGSSKLLQKNQILGKQVEPNLINNLLQEIIQNPQLSKEVIQQAQQLAESLVEKEEQEPIFLEDYLTFLEKFAQIKIWTGSEALEALLKGVDLDHELTALKKESGETTHKNAEKHRFLQALQDSGNKLEWMIMHKLPVIPCGLRPIVKLKGEEKLAAAQLDELYRVAIAANQRLKECLIKSELLYPEIIYNEKRRLQKSIDQLIYKSPYQGIDTSKSLAQNLSGKEGILRRYSLGKRVDYSARSVIVPNPSLRIDQVGLPFKIILGLFRPFIIQKICQKVQTTQKKDISMTEAEQILNEENPLVFSVLNEVIQNHPVLVNRAPSLHRLSIQGFYPQLADGNSIELHPLVTTALNADFDGDQVAIYLPVTKKTQEEAKEKILSSHHIVDPKNGHLIAIPSQDMILGIYSLTKEIKPTKRLYFDHISSIWRSHEQGSISLNELVIVPARLVGRNFATAQNQFLFTTLGKLIFNQILPPSFPFYLSDLKESEPVKSRIAEVNEIEKKWTTYQPLSGWKKKDLIEFLNRLVKETPHLEMIEFLDQLKKVSFDYAAQSGISISPFELAQIITKSPSLEKAQQEIEQIDQEYLEGYHNEEEDKQKRLTTWENCKENLQQQLLNNLEKKTTTSFYQIWDSGARISTESLVQLFAMRGHATNYLGEIIQTPIVSSLWEGLSPPEFFISVYGTIKGMIDIALKTAEAGYLTRRLVESSQNLIILVADCKTTQGIWLAEANEFRLAQKVYGRYLAQAVVNSKKEVILPPNTLLLKNEIKLIQDQKITSLSVFSPLKCELVNGLCQKCYGSDLSKPGEVIPIGTAVGIIAAQSLGEPGTQLTMRTFHAGKVSGEEDITQGLPKVKQIFDNLKPLEKSRVVLATAAGKIEKVDAANGCLFQKVGEELKTYSWKGEKIILVSPGEMVKKGQTLTSGAVDLEKYLEVMGRDSCQNYIKAEVSKVYQEQGIEINDRHVEIFARQMLSRVKITDSGDSKYLLGEIVNYQQIQKDNQILINQGKKKAEFQNLISSLKDLASRPPSFLAGISFQNTLKSLVNYSLYRPVDYLCGSKESLIAGQLVPVGTGFEERKKVLLKHMLTD